MSTPHTVDFVLSSDVKTKTSDGVKSDDKQHPPSTTSQVDHISQNLKKQISDVKISVTPDNNIMAGIHFHSDGTARDSSGNIIQYRYGDDGFDPRYHDATSDTAAAVTATSTNILPQPLLRGAFILFEGLDRSGKTTQCTKLVERLKSEKQPVLYMRFPDRETVIGKMIDAYLKGQTELNDQVIHLLYSANRWESSEKIKAALLSGKTIVMDRYSYSGVAFSSAKGMNMNWCWEPEKGLPAPDVILSMTINPEEASKRANYGAERYDKKEFQLKVEGKFEEMKKLHQIHKWVTLDGSKSIEHIHEFVWTIVEKTREIVATTPMNLLS